MWRLLFYLNTFDLIVLVSNSNFNIVYYNANGKCPCNRSYQGPTFLKTPTKETQNKIPIQCPQNIRNWGGVRAFLTEVENKVVTNCAIADYCRRIGRENNHETLLNTSVFDFIVVGAGTAGSIVAGRLAVDTGKTVLLIEAGDAEPIYSRVPAFFKYYRFNNDTDWMYTTKHSKHYCKITRGICRLPRGKALGGTSIFNDMIYQRGHPYDCGTWFRSEGRSYTCSDFEYYYRKFENHLDIADNPAKLYGKDGPMPLQKRPNHKHAIVNRFIKAAKDIGFEFIGDMLNTNTLSGGFGIAYTFTANGQRFTTARTYLNHNLKNLLVVLKAHVNKVIFDRNNRAYKVEYVLNENWNKRLYVRVREEIILSAGTFNSPKILMLSGIGPKAELERLNISIVKDLPVGQNMKSHYGFRMRYGLGYYADHLKKKWSYVKYFFSSQYKFLWQNAMVYFYPNLTMRKLIYSDLLDDDSLDQYLKTGKGPMSSNGLTQLVGMFTSNLTKNKNKPDIQILLSGFNADCSRTKKQNLTQAIQYYYPSHEGDRVYNGTGYRVVNETGSVARINVDLNAFAGRNIDAYVILLNPRSVGNVTLNSTNPKDHPIIEANYLEDYDDLSMLIEGGRIVDDLFLAQSLKDLKMELPLKYFRPCTTYERYPYTNKPYYFPSGFYYSIPNRKLDNKFFTCLIEHYTVGKFHQQGTTSIGHVVNENLQVKGVTGLRVVDGSVIPTTISGSPQGTIMMFAERTVDMITEELRSPQFDVVPETTTEMSTTETSTTEMSTTETSTTEMRSTEVGYE